MGNYNKIPLHGSQPCCGKGACVTQAMSCAVQGHPRWMGHSGEFGHNVGTLEEGLQTTPVFLPRESHEKYDKAKRYNAGR